MACKTKKEMGGLLNLFNVASKAATGNFLGAATQFMAPALENMQQDSAKVTSDATYNTKPFGMKYGGSIHIKPENRGKFTATKKRTGKTTEELTHSSNPLTRKRAIFAQNARKWKHEDGGTIPSGFVQYDAPSHDNGGQVVDSQGYPTVNNAVAEIQNKENSFNNYVFSDVLENPKTGRTFNVDMSKLMKKYKNADTDLISKRSLDIEADTLAKTNDTVKAMVEQMTVPEAPMMPNGGPLDYLTMSPIQPIVPGLTGYTQDENLNLPHIQDPFETMAGRPIENPFDPYTTAPQINTPVKSTTIPVDPLQRFSNASDAPPIDNTDTQAGEPKQRSTNFNTLAAVSKGLGLANSVFNALKPAEKEQARIPDYNPADQAFDRASIDYTQARQDATGASNILANINRSTSSGFSQYRNREAGRIASLMDRVSNIGMTERNANSQLDISRGQYRADKAVDIANRQREVDVANLQNEAVKQQFSDNLFSEISQIGSSLNQYQNFKDELANRTDIATMNTNEFVALAKAKGLDFNYGEAEEFLNAIKSGKNPIKTTTTN